MCKTIRIKPHHFIDILTALGAGKLRSDPHPYGHALHLVSEKVVGHLDTMLELVLGADEICDPCIHNLDGICDDVIDISYRPEAPSGKQDWNLRLDRRWCKALATEEGDLISVRAFCIRLKQVNEAMIDEIYREIPGHLRLERSRYLRKGIDSLLADN